jgi:hypothetical protein
MLKAGMARMLVKSGLTIAVLALAFAAAGCGSTRTVTVVQTVTNTKTVMRRAPARTITRTVTAPAATSTSPTYASGYPASFERAFSIQCQQTGGTYRACGCALNRVESTVSYHTVVAAEHAIAIGNPPGWYTSAAASCTG